jgi:hypothetical protein
MDFAAIHLLHPLAVALLMLVLMAGAIELGYRVGLRTRRRSGDPEAIAKRDVTLGALLALLGLLLAFTYSFSLSRADLRKEALLTEANALGTAFLRADLAPEPARTALRQALYEYARTRVVDSAGVSTSQTVAATIARSEEKQRALWPAVKAVLAEEPPGPLANGLVAAMTEVLDLHAARVARFSDRLPLVVFWLLVLVTAAALAVAAHNAGLAGHISRTRMGAFAVVLSALIAVIIDFDQPQRGAIVISQAPLTRTITAMADELGTVDMHPD